MDFIISGRQRDLGVITVTRSLPHAKKRHIGPFVFLDHMGPMEIDSEHFLDVHPHPHIGLSTVTYLFEGSILHKDSIGSEQIIHPGDLNWMTAGKGIVHSERTPKNERNSQDHKKIHGIQIWVALPLDKEELSPNFTHYPSKSLPEFKIDNTLNAKLLIGEFQEHFSPVKTFSKMIFLEINSDITQEKTISFDEEEIGIFLISGGCTINDQVLQKNDLIALENSNNIKINFLENTKLIVIGGSNFSEPRYIWWNFVSSKKARIHKAAEDWKHQRIGKVIGEDDITPLPEIPLP